MVKLTTIENMTVKFCAEAKKYISTIDLSYTTISDVSKILVKLYSIRRTLDKLETLNRRTEVIDQNTGKSLGYLYDDENIGNIMLSTGIKTNAKIQSCENHIGYLTKQMLI